MKVVTKVYRLEHPEYGTPYSNRWRDEIKDDELWEIFDGVLFPMREDHKADSRPGVREEFPHWFKPEKYFCGCTSLEKLKEWFTTDNSTFKELTNLGYEVVVYEVPQSCVIEGKLQCIFEMEHARIAG